MHNSQKKPSTFDFLTYAPKAQVKIFHFEKTKAYQQCNVLIATSDEIFLSK